MDRMPPSMRVRNDQTPPCPKLSRAPMNTRRGGVKRMPSPKALPPAPASEILVTGGVLVVEEVEEVREQLEPVVGERVVVEQPDVDDPE